MRAYHDKSISHAPGYEAPEIDLSGLRITVPKGTRATKGDPLGEDYVFELESAPTEKTTIQGILVKDKTTGATSLLIDEINSHDPPWDPSNDDPVEWLMPIFVLQVPAGHNDFSSCNIDIFRCVQQDPAPAPKEG